MKKSVLAAIAWSVCLATSAQSNAEATSTKFFCHVGKPQSCLGLNCVPMAVHGGTIPIPVHVFFQGEAVMDVRTDCPDATKWTISNRKITVVCDGRDTDLGYISNSNFDLDTNEFYEITKYSNMPPLSYTLRTGVCRVDDFEQRLEQATKP